VIRSQTGTPEGYWRQVLVGYHHLGTFVPFWSTRLICCVEITD
jgi:hypothetical protein